MVEQTASVEGMAGARVGESSRGLGPGVVQRRDLTRSMRAMLANSKLSRIAPAAGDVLGGIPSFLARDGAPATPTCL